MTARLIPPGARETWVDLPAGRLRVLRGGTEGPPLVLIHGGGSDNAAISWYRLFAPLARDHQVIAPDLPGFGDSAGVPPAGGPDRMADVIAQVMQHCGTGPATVTGVSMGGDVALNLALRHPNRVARLVLIAPGGLMPRLRGRVTQFAAWALGKLPDGIMLPVARFGGRFTEGIIRRMVHDPATVPPEITAEMTAEARRKGAGIGFLRYNQATLGPGGMRNDLTSRVAAITAPTLLFHGENDPLVPPEGSRRAAARMPDARLVMVPGCGHWAQIEAHDRFLAELRAFLSPP